MTPGGRKRLQAVIAVTARFWVRPQNLADIARRAGGEIARDFQQLAAVLPSRILAEGQIVGL